MHLLNTLIIEHTHINLITYTNLNTPKSHTYIHTSTRLHRYEQTQTSKHIHQAEHCNLYIHGNINTQIKKHPDLMFLLY